MFMALLVTLDSSLAAATVIYDSADIAFTPVIRLDIFRCVVGNELPVYITYENLHLWIRLIVSLVC